MKRHPALEQLSRDHHHALVVAQRLKRADDTTAAALIARVLTDHVRIRHLADRLNGTENTQLGLEHELGERLERHVRLEERELFPLIESVVPEPELQRLVAALSH